MADPFKTRRITFRKTREVTNFGCNIRRAREESGMTQLELSVAAKINRVTIANLETGHQRGIQVDSLVSLCRALAVTPNDLLGFYDGVRR